MRTTIIGTMRAAFVIPKRAMTGHRHCHGDGDDGHAAYCGSYDHFRSVFRRREALGQPLRRQEPRQGRNSQAQHESQG